MYANYVEAADPISQKLIHILERFEASPEGLSLQALGGYVQWLSAENKRFKDQFQYGEETFASYKLIQQATNDLVGVWQYWRLSDNFKESFRGTKRAAFQDNQVIRVRLQSAREAIVELKELSELRASLNKSVDTFEAER